ncbi:MAG: hypothetical protein ACI9UK_001316 [Candidatus Krumholzibacteriia bacterium]|jgi:hypothetical protein
MAYLNFVPVLNYDETILWPDSPLFFVLNDKGYCGAGGLSQSFMKLARGGVIRSLGMGAAAMGIGRFGYLFVSPQGRCIPRDKTHDAVEVAVA